MLVIFGIALGSSRPKYPYRYHVVFIHDGSGTSSLGQMDLSRKRPIDSADAVKSVTEYVLEEARKDLPGITKVVLLNWIKIKP